ncbi:MAG: type IX secretion system protein PorQ [Cyclobacteriaceae bacterium]
MRLALAFCLVASLAGYGQGLFSAHNIPASAHIAALGGDAVASTANDPGLILNNPASINFSESGQTSILVNPHFAGINHFAITNAFEVGSLGKFGMGINYLGYGKMNITSETGEILGDFQPRDYMISIGKAQTIGPFSLGLNIKYAGSHLVSQNYSAALFDFGGSYKHPSQPISFGMVIRNFGFQISGIQHSKLPFDLVVGTSISPAHMPFRFDITGSNLTSDFGNYYVHNPNDPPSTPNLVLRYLNVGTTLLIGEIIELTIGYNHRRREELRLPQGAYGAGFSYGIMIRIKDYDLRFTRATYHAAGGSSFISLSGNLNTIKKIF